METQWNEEARKKYTEITDSLPQFHRTIAKQLVEVKAEELSRKRGAKTVEEEDLITAFFQEVPPAFKEMMKKLLAKHDIDYARYIKEK